MPSVPKHALAWHVVPEHACEQGCLIPQGPTSLFSITSVAMAGGLNAGRAPCQCNSLAAVQPELVARQWDFEANAVSPADMLPRSHKKVGALAACRPA